MLERKFEPRNSMTVLASRDRTKLTLENIELDARKRIPPEGLAAARHLFSVRRSAHADRGTSRVAISGR